MDKPMTYTIPNVYLAAFLISQEEFKLGPVYLPEHTTDGKVLIDILYDPKHQLLLEQLVKAYFDKKAIVRLEAYQQNIRFIMKLVNQRKSNIPCPISK